MPENVTLDSVSGCTHLYNDLPMDRDSVTDENGSSGDPMGNRDGMGYLSVTKFLTAQPQYLTLLPTQNGGLFTQQ